MKHTVIHAQPVLPPIEKIILELTPAEFLSIYRQMKRGQPEDRRIPFNGETKHGIEPSMNMYGPLDDIAYEAGIRA